MFNIFIHQGVRLSKDDVYKVCVILVTAAFCLKTVEDLEKRLKHEVSYNQFFFLYKETMFISFSLLIFLNYTRNIIIVVYYIDEIKLLLIKRAKRYYHFK